MDGLEIKRHAEPAPLWRFAGVVTALLLFLLSAGSFVQAGRYVLDPSLDGRPRASLVRVDGGLAELKAVAPDSPFAAAGLREGDRLRLDHPWDDLSVLSGGDDLGATRVSPGRPTHVVVHLRPASRAEPGLPGQYLAEYLIRLALLLLGLFTVWRGYRDTSAFVLGLAFMAQSVVPTFLLPVPSVLLPYVASTFICAVTLASVLLLRFAMLYYDMHTGSLAQWENRLFYAFSALLAVLMIPQLIFYLGNAAAPEAVAFVTAMQAVTAFIFVGPIVYFLRGLLRSHGTDRRRYSLMLLALPLSMCVVTAHLIVGLLHLDAIWPVADIGLDIAQIIGVLLFTYAVLREKLFDVGFAINRVLVYGVASAVLLVLFGLLEWLAEKFIPIEGREKNALLDAGLALFVFLIFHRVRDFVEHHIESVLFRSWQDNEKALRQFVEEAFFINRPEAVATALLAEMRRFTQGAPCALYLASGESYGLAHGALPGAPAAMDVDTPLAVALRARRKAVEPSPQDSLPAALVLPLAAHQDLQGFVALGAKPSGAAYRPDEEGLLAWAVHQVASHLHALKIEQLENDKATLEIQCSELRGLIGERLVAVTGIPVT